MNLQVTEKTMDSREIAELTGKAHRNVTIDIETQLGKLEGGVQAFQHTYTNEQNGQVYKCYRLPYRETMILVSGYSIELRAKVIDRWMELEKANAKPMSALDIIAAQVKVLQEIEAKQQEQEKRIDALEKNRLPIPASASEEFVIPTILGKMFDPPKTAQSVNQALKTAGLQYRVGGEWVATEEGKKWSKIFPTVLDTGKAVYQVSWMRGVVELLK